MHAQYDDTYVNTHGSTARFMVHGNEIDYIPEIAWLVRLA